ncbi:MAG: glycosyltransferase [Candidatus Hydrogenedentes bacterium]|nr:glycosyltransferase [Candidatus Hydrogenedentota bacterium]
MNALSVRAAAATIIPMKIDEFHVSPRLKELLKYDKFAEPAPRILILESRYWLDDACVHACQTLGWPHLCVPVVQEGLLPKENVANLLTCLADFKPDFVFSVNLAGMDEDGLLARIYNELAIPYVTWFVDNPRTIVAQGSSVASDHAAAFTWDGAYEPYLRELGFGLTATLPLAHDTGRFSVPDGPAGGIPPSFVTNTMTQMARQEWQWLDRCPGLQKCVAHAFDAGLVTRNNFARGLEALLPNHELDTASLDEKRHVERYFFLEGTRRLRVDTANALLAEGLELYGDDAWREVLPSAKPYIHYGDEVMAHYKRSVVNVNSTSLQMPEAVNQRVFDCPVAGGFLLTDNQASLKHLFAEDEVAVYKDLGDCRDLLSFYRAEDAARKDIADRARDRILNEHTYVHRFQEMVKLLTARFR